MYTNDNQTKFSLKDIVLQFLFVALFIFILLWLFPMKSDFKKLEKSVNELSENGLLAKDATGELNLAVLFDRIFNENVIAMKEAAKSYYTTSRLPQKVGETSKLTLKEMLEKKIILPFVDKNGKACDTKGSYVEVTKYEDEYVMKINLKCGDQEDYLLVHMGCYDYCKTTICEKKTTAAVVKKAATVKKTTPVKTIGSPSCTLTVASGTLGNDGYYTSDIVIKFKSKSAGSNATLSGSGLGTSVNYNGSTSYTVSKDGTTTIYGYVKNSGGKTAQCSITVKKATPVKQETACVWGDWSNWSTTNYTASATRQVRYQTLLTGYNVKTVYDTTKPIFDTKAVAIADTTTTSCSKYNYSGSIKYSAWKLVGTVKLTSAPTNTDTVKYEKVGDYDWYCTSSTNCTAGTVMVYKKYEKTVTSSTGSYSCSKWVTDTKVTVANKTVLTGYETKTEKTPVYKTEYSYRDCR